MSDILNRRLAPSDKVADSPVGEETVLLHLADGTYYGLDGVGSRIWVLLKEGMASAEICRGLAEEFGIPVETIEADVRRFLAELEAEGLLSETGN